MANTKGLGRRAPARLKGQFSMFLLKVAFLKEQAPKQIFLGKDNGWNMPPNGTGALHRICHSRSEK